MKPHFEALLVVMCLMMAAFCMIFGKIFYESSQSNYTHVVYTNKYGEYKIEIFALIAIFCLSIFFLIFGYYE